jgi:hypothetical protein
MMRISVDEDMPKELDYSNVPHKLYHGRSSEDDYFEEF